MPTNIYRFLVACAAVLGSFCCQAQDLPWHNGPYTEADTALAIQQYTNGFRKTYSNPDSALLLTEQGLEVSRGIPFPKGEAMARNILGIICDVTGRFDVAMGHYRATIAIAKREHLARIEGQAYNNIGLIHWNQSNIDSAIFYYTLSSNIFEQVNYKRGRANSINNVGLLYREQALYTKALRFFREALKLYRELDEIQLIGAAYNNIGLAFDDLEQLDSAVVYYEQAVELRTLKEDYFGLSKTLTNLGLAYRQLKMDDKAEAALKKSLDYHYNLNDAPGHASTAMNLASFYLARRDDVANAKRYVKEARSIADSGHYARFQWKIYDLEARIASRTGNYKQAYEYLKRSRHIEDSLERAETAAHVLQLETQYETALHQKQISELRQQQVADDLALAERDLEIERSQKGLIVLTAMLILVLVVGGSAYVFYRNRQQKRYQLALIEQQELGLQAVIQTQEAERKRIARELHDGVGQLLSGLKLTWDQLKANIAQLPEEDQKVYTSSSELLDDACSEVRSISHQMMPRALSEAGLVPAVEALLQKTVAHSGINYNFESFGLEERYGEPVEVSIYRILQEVVGNVLKHAQATFFSVQLFRSREHLVLVVEDNGVGIDSQGQKGSGLGLTNIRTRAHSINAVVNFGSAPNGGTVFTLRAPIG